MRTAQRRAVAARVRPGGDLADGRRHIASDAAVANLGLDWHVLGVGDFNADGHSDVLLWHNSGQVVEWQMDGATIVGNRRREHRRELAPR